MLWRSSWGGGDMLARSWSVYSGSDIALTGDIEATGWRLRSTAGYGQYSYRKWTRGLDGPENVKFRGHKTFSDVLVGYQYQWQDVTVKAFAGVASEQHIVDPRDPDMPAAGFSYGGKVALEAWVNLSRRYWIAGETSWASTINSYKVGLRSGYRLLADADLSLDAGIEARLEGDDSYLAGRGGVFTTLMVGDAGVTAAVGATGDRDGRASPYASVSVFYRY